MAAPSAAAAAAAAVDPPRELTEDEVRDNLLEHIWDMVDYWTDESRVTDTREKMAGLAFSILTVLDGESGNMPGFLVAAQPHEDDKEYRRKEGENWYPTEIKDIGGCLHERWHSLDPKKTK